MATCKEWTHKAECMDENGKTPYIAETIMAGNVEDLCKRFTEELQNKPLIKPPLGAEPAFLVYDVRIRKLCEAILRAIEYPRRGKKEFRNIANWSYELNAIARLRIDLEANKTTAPRGE